MDNNDSFKMTYSANRQEEIQAIRKKYMPQQENKMEQLRALDAAVSGKASRAAIIIGVLGTLIMGAGMSIIMSDFGKLLGAAAPVVGTVAGIVGIVMLACAYPVYNRTLRREREKAAPEIIKLTDELMQ